MTELEDKIKCLRRRASSGSKSADKDLSFSSLAFRASIDMVAGILVGTAIGYFLDDLWNSGPWLLLLGFILGSSAGFMNVFRTVKKYQNASASSDPSEGNKP